MTNSSLSFEIRRAIPDDWRTIAEFNIRLAEETEDKQLDRQTVENGVRRLLADASRGIYYLAIQADQVIGQLMHTREWSDWRDGDLWWLQSVYVHPAFRRQGVFRALLQRLRDEAAVDPDVVGLRLYVEVENLRAQTTYRDLEFRTPGYLVMEDLPAGP